MKFGSSPNVVVTLGKDFAIPKNKVFSLILVPINRERGNQSFTLD